MAGTIEKPQPSSVSCVGLARQVAKEPSKVETVPSVFA
jgi:hypothetical protein